MKQANVFLTALIAALTAVSGLEDALQALIRHHGGKRTAQLCEDIVTALRVAYPKTDAVVGVYKKQPTVSFPDKGAGYEMYKAHIRPYLPALRGATGGKKSSRTDAVELLVAYITKSGVTKSQAARAVEAAFRK